MELEIQYFPQTDTLYIGTSQIANEGYDLATNVIAHSTEDGEVVGITLEHAVQVLAPHLSEYMTNRQQTPSTSILRDDGETA